MSATTIDLPTRGLLSFVLEQPELSHVLVLEGHARDVSERIRSFLAITPEGLIRTVRRANGDESIRLLNGTRVDFVNVRSVERRVRGCAYSAIVLSDYARRVSYEENIDLAPTFATGPVVAYL